MNSWLQTQSFPVDVVLQQPQMVTSLRDTGDSLPQRRVIPTQQGDLLVETRDGFWMVVPAWNLDVAPGLVRDGFIEPWTSAVFRHCIATGDTVFNVGANFGYYSLLAAQLVGRTGKVFAFEANPTVFCYLVKSVYWGGYPDVVRAFQAACVSPQWHNQPIRIQYDPQFIGGGSILATRPSIRELSDCFWTAANIHHTLDENRCFQPRSLSTESVTLGKTIDSIIPENLVTNCMLIDAEGSESHVILGAEQMIRRSQHLSIIMEWDPSSYQRHPERRGSIDSMWDLLLNQEKFSVSRICCENYGGWGTMPDLVRLNRQSLMDIPHSDLLLQRDR